MSWCGNFKCNCISCEDEGCGLKFNCCKAPDCCTRRGWCLPNDEDKKKEGPRKRRSCRDLIWLLAFIAFWAGMIVVAVKAFIEGDVRRFYYGTDMFGNMCGLDNTLSGHPDALDLRNFSVLYWPTPFDTDIQICIHACPNETMSVGDVGLLFTPSLLANATEARQQLICMYDTPENDTIPSFMDVLRGDCFPPYASEALLGRCAPNPDAAVHVQDMFTAYFFGYETTNLTAYNTSDFLNYTVGNSSQSNFQSDFIDLELAEAIYSNLNSRQYLSTVFTDMYTAWWYILIFAGVAVLISWIFLILLRLFAWIIIWFTIGLVYLMLILLTALVWYQSAASASALPDSDYRLVEDVRLANGLRVLAYVLLGIDIVFFLILLVLRKRIKLAIAVVKEAGKSMTAMPSIMFFPFVPFILLAALYIYWVIVAAFLATASLSPTGVSLTLPGDMVVDDALQYLVIYHLFGLLWTTAFIGAMMEVSMAGAVAAWYWVREDENGKRKVPRFAVVRSFLRVWRYHLGSIAKGSFLLAVVQFIRIMLRYAQHKLRGSESKAAKYALKALSCCFWCLEKFIKFINRNAYVMIAIKGDSFCSSAKRAFTLILSNILRVGAVNGVSTFLLFLLKLAIAISTATLAAFVMRYNENLHYWIIPCILILIIAWVVAHAFTCVYAMAIDTILLSYCEDEECFKSVDRDEEKYKMYASGNLKNFISAHIKEKKEIHKEHDGKDKEKLEEHSFGPSCCRRKRPRKVADEVEEINSVEDIEMESSGKYSD